MSIQKGEEVWLKNWVKHEGLNPKLQPCWCGPYKKLSDLTYVIQKGKGRSFQVHAEILHRHVKHEDYDKREGTSTTEERSAPTQEGDELGTDPTRITL